MADLVLKERYFCHPLCFECSQPGKPAKVREHSRRRGRQGGPQKGLGKGKGKSLGLAKVWNKLKRVTDDGQQICFKFKGQCDRAHVCQLCLAKHPVHACPLLREDKAGVGVPIQE